MKTAILIFALLGGAAYAQDGDRRDYGRPLDTPENRADMGMRFAARCVVLKTPASARKVLETGIASDEEAKKVKGLTGVARECFQPQWPAFPSTGFRNALAEVTYRQAHDREPTFAAQPAPASFGVVETGRQGAPQQQVAWSLAAIANCTVFVAPHEAHRLIVGPRNVDEELHRFDALKPAIGKCVAPEQMAMLNARNFRGAVATALLMRANGAEKK